MVAAGITIPDAMRMLADSSNKYLRSILEDTLHYIANGANLGSALNNTGRDFPNREIIGDLAIYAEMNNFDEIWRGLQMTIWKNQCARWR